MLPKRQCFRGATVRQAFCGQMEYPKPEEQPLADGYPLGPAPKREHILRRSAVAEMRANLSLACGRGSDEADLETAADFRCHSSMLAEPGKAVSRLESHKN